MIWPTLPSSAVPETDARLVKLQVPKNCFIPRTCTFTLGHLATAVQFWAYAAYLHPYGPTMSNMPQTCLLIAVSHCPTCACYTHSLESCKKTTLPRPKPLPFNLNASVWVTKTMHCSFESCTFGCPCLYQSKAPRCHHGREANKLKGKPCNILMFFMIGWLIEVYPKTKSKQTGVPWCCKSIPQRQLNFWNLEKNQQKKE